MKLTRRDTLTLAAAATFAGAAGLPNFAFAAEGDVIDQVKLMAPNGIPDKIKGNPDAKVTFIEYASPTCPHCAAFSNDILPAFEAKYVETGQVKFIIRPFARNTMDAAIFMLAEAAAKAANGAGTVNTAETTATTTWSQDAVAAYENVLSAFYRTQDSWGVSETPLDAVKAVATQLGFTETSFNEALTDQDYFNAVQSMRDQAVNEFGLEGTPTFYVNGKQLTGEKTLDELSAEIDPLL